MIQPIPPKAKKTVDYLSQADANNPLGYVLARLGKIQALDQALRRLLPIPLADYCRAANLKLGKLVIQVDSSAWATRLRFELPALLSQLREQPQFASLSGIDFFVAPFVSTASWHAVPVATHTPMPSLSPANQQLLLSLANSVEDTQLKKVLKQIATRQG